jgi:hypothetical protein
LQGGGGAREGSTPRVTATGVVTGLEDTAQIKTVVGLNGALGRVNDQIPIHPRTYASVRIKDSRKIAPVKVT